jgi:hypothetical protein
LHPRVDTGSQNQSDRLGILKTAITILAWPDESNGTSGGLSLSRDKRSMTDFPGFFG